MTFTQLPQEEAIILFCDRIRNANANLPTFYHGATFNSLCESGGPIETARGAIYCATHGLASESPAGEYSVSAHTQDGDDHSYDEYTFTFEYLELTAFELDFRSLHYGGVQLQTLATIRRDTAFEKGFSPSVRNTGNTRFNVTVLQDDMGVGKNGSGWNIEYSALVGSNVFDLALYRPEEEMALEDIVDMGVSESMSFKVMIHSFESARGNDSGVMTIGAKRALFRQCVSGGNV